MRRESDDFSAKMSKATTMTEISVPHVLDSQEAIRQLLEASTDFHKSGTGMVENKSTIQVWKSMADTDLLNQVLGNPISKTIYQPQSRRRTVEWNFNNQTVRYTEEPFQWEQGRWYCIVRELIDHPLFKKVWYLVTLRPYQDNTKVEMVSAFAINERKGEDQAEINAAADTLCMHSMVLDKLASLSQPQGWIPPNRTTAASPCNMHKLEVARRSLLDLGEDPQIVSCLIQHLQAALLADLVDMQPRKLAHAWKQNDTHDSNKDGDEACVSVFLRASRIGLLRPQWAFLCKSCRGTKQSRHQVYQLDSKKAHCEDCNLNMDPTQIQTSVQLVFSPGQGVLEGMENDGDLGGRACVGSPTRTPHWFSQAHLDPSECRCVLNLSLRQTQKKKCFKLKCPQLQVEFNVTSAEEMVGVWHLTTSGFVKDDERALDMKKNAVVMNNQTNQRLSVIIEDETSPYYSEALLAKQVLEHPGFAMLFGAEEWEFLAAMAATWQEEFQIQSAPATVGPGCSFDLAVVGSGPAGESLALAASKLGARVALIEKEPSFGGPTGLGSKAFREAALKVRSWARMNEARPDSETLQSIFNSRFGTFRDYVVTLVSHELMCRLGKASISLVRGRGYLNSIGRLQVERSDGTVIDIDAPNIGLAVGSHPARPSNVPFDGVRVLDAEEISKISSLPRSMAVIGGGIIACEYGCIFGILGVQTHVINAYPTFLPMLDRGLCEGLLKSMEGEGVQFHREVKVQTWHNEVDKRISLTLSNGTTITVDMVLYAQGREGSTENLCCSQISLNSAKRGYLHVEEDFVCATGCPGVYAIGDVAGPPGLASSAMDQGRRLAENLFGDGLRESQSSPLVLWTIPEVASVGLTKEQVENDRSVFSSRALFRELPRGLLSGDLDGWLELLVDAESGCILGVNLFGCGASELIHFGASLVSNETTCTDLSRQVFAAVTLHDLFNVAADRADMELRSRAGKSPREDHCGSA